MISLRRSFALSVFFTGVVLLLLGACSLASPPTSSTTAPTATVQRVPPASGAATATVAGVTERATTVPPRIETPTPTSKPATPTPAIPQGGTLTIRATAPITSFTPWNIGSRGEEYVADLLYNGLTRLDATLKPQPDLAEGWTTSTDGRLITFTLRSGVKWHDGQPLTGDDVVWTLKSARGITATNALLYDLQTAIADVRSPVSNTVVLSLTQAYAPLLADLALPILPRHIWQTRTPAQLATLNTLDNPIGSGPFKFSEKKEQGITFVRNDQFFRGRPNLDGVALVVAPETKVVVPALNDGTLGLAEFDPASFVTVTQQLDQRLRRDGYPENGFYFLAFNTRQGKLFGDGRLRQALALAVDVQKLAGDVVGEEAVPLATSISPAAWAFPKEATPGMPDPERARQLLDEAGWKLPPGQTVRARDGISLTAQLFVRGDDQRRLAAARRIADAAGQIGMKIEVAPADFRTVILAKLAPPYEFDLLLGSWINAPNTAGYPTTRYYDPDDYAIFGADRIWRGAGDTRAGLRNIGGFTNPDYEAVAQRARGAYDPNERAAAIAASQAIIRREQPYLFLWTDRVPVVLSPKVYVEGGDVPLNSPRYLWNIERWYIK